MMSKKPTSKDMDEGMMDQKSKENMPMMSEAEMKRTHEQMQKLGKKKGK